MTHWPFSQAELTAGLRRYFAEPKLQVQALAEQPLPGGVAVETVRALRVTYAVGGDSFEIDCVVKEPRGASRPGLAGAGRREIGLYQALAGHLPLATPTLIAADPGGRWLVLEAVDPGVPLARWGADEYRRAVLALADLHERFWGLADDLAAYPWLARPLGADFEVHVYAAAQAVERMIMDDWPRQITTSMRHLATLGQIISQVETVVQPLHTGAHTLLHGDFWAGNIALQADGDVVVLDWQAAGLGPGVLDLVAFLATSRWRQGPLPLSAEALTSLYREEMQRRVGVNWPEADWDRLQDHALLWRFVQELPGWLTRPARAEIDARAEAFEVVWLAPALAAAERRLRPVLYF